MANYSHKEPIAIIGIGCRFPGAIDRNAYWQLLCDGIDAIGEVPVSRWDGKQLYDPDPSTPFKMNTRWGGFIDQADCFDPDFFNSSPREASCMSADQRLVLEMSWRAMEDAGIIPSQTVGQSIGVFIGTNSEDYSSILGPLEVVDRYNEPHFTTGTSRAVIANRLSYLYDWNGPSMVVDTACSASMLATHLACQSLWQQETSMALAGGVQLQLRPGLSVSFSKGRFMASDGRCKAFDAKANGYVRGEGVGIVVLKPLSQAVADGDRIYALIRGSAVNHNGRSNGLTAPNPLAQEALLRAVYQDAGVSPGQVQYVEAHGTGTQLGDYMELEALQSVLREDRPAGAGCFVGSVKTNIGHPEGAAGIAGLIKTALALHHGQIPSNLHFETPNPHIDFDALPLIVPQQLTPWPDVGPREGSEPEPKQGSGRLAGVSSFGFGGANAHVVLEGVDLGRREQREQGRQRERSHHILTLSARNEKALRELAQSYVQRLTNAPSEALADICFSGNTGRSQFAERLAVIGATLSDCCQKLDAFIQDSTEGTALEQGNGQKLSQATDSLSLGYCYKKGVERNRPKIAMLFTGQGSQYVGMAQTLYDTQPTFKRMMDQCAEILRPDLDKPLLEVIQSSEVHQTAYTQPALFAVEYALFHLWHSWGVNPAMVMGHSVGEYVAACVAGVFSLEDGLKLIAARGKLMQQLPPSGIMVSVMASAAQVKSVMVSISNLGDLCAIAAINGPYSTVISGSEDAVQAVVTRLENRGFKTKQLQVSHGFHSPLMQPMLADFRQVAEQMTYSSPQLKFVSNMTGQLASEEVACPDYWCQHVLAPVNFLAGMATLDQQDCGVFLECGPKPILLGMGRQCLPEKEALWLPSLWPSPENSLGNNPGNNQKHSQWHNQHHSQDDWPPLLTSLGELYVRGVAIAWTRFDHDYPQRQKVDIPGYPFQYQRFWVDIPNSSSRDTVTSQGLTDLPQEPALGLLGDRLSLPFSEQIRFQTHFTTSYPDYVTDHQYYNHIVVAGASHIVMGLSAVQSMTKQAGTRQAGTGQAAWSLCHIRFLDILGMTSTTPRTVQVVLEPQANGEYDYKLISCVVGHESETSEWTVHVTAKIRPFSPTSAPLTRVNMGMANMGTIDMGGAEMETVDIPTIQHRCSRTFSHDEYYDAILVPMGDRFSLGEQFKWTEYAWIGNGEALLKLKSHSIPPFHRSILPLSPHPGLLDSGLVAIPFLNALPYTEAHSKSHPEHDKKYEPISYAFVGAEQFTLIKPLEDTKPYWFYVKLDDQLQSHATGNTTSSSVLRGDSYLIEQDGTVVAMFSGVQFRELKLDALANALGIDLEKGNELVSGLTSGLVRLGDDPNSHSDSLSSTQSASEPSQLAPQLAEFIEQLQRVDAWRRQQLLVDYVTDIVTTVLRRSDGDRPSARDGFFNLGLDSLMAVDLVNAIQRDLGIKLSATAAFEYANIEELSRYLDQSLPQSHLPQFHQDEAMTPKPQDWQMAGQMVNQISQMGEAEVNDHLIQELAKLEAHLNNT